MGHTLKLSNSLHVRCAIWERDEEEQDEQVEECFTVQHIARVAKGDIALFTLVLENGVLLLQREFRFGCCYTVRGYTVRGTRWCWVYHRLLSSSPV